MSSPKNNEESPKDFVSTLPLQKNYTFHPVYKHQGFWYIKRHLLGAISSQKHFETRDSDVFVVSFPKCGTTWLKALTFALLNRKGHPIASEDHPLLARNPQDLVPFIDMNLYVDDKIPDMESIPSPRLLATHMPFTALPDSIKSPGSECKLVYVARNPKDAFVSLWHFHKKIGYVVEGNTIEDALECFCEGLIAYGPYWDHVLDYSKQSMENPDKVLFLKYEDMKEEPRVHLRRIAEFLNCPFSEEEEGDWMVDQVLKLCSFDNLTSLEVNKTGITISGIRGSALFRKGEVGDWENYLTPEMAAKIDRITRDKFFGSGLVI